ncbi:MAG: TonB-dependent receptor [Bacteroidales bacterium]|nr:TonB-dependent receptor [Bacteroidales bacterium]
MAALKTIILLLLLMPAYLFAQEIKGFVYENEGNTPVANANLVVPGTNIGTVSGIDGSFTLGIQKTGQVKLVVSYIGYENTVQIFNIPVSGLDVIILLKSKVSEIEETVITATRTKKSINELPASVRLITAEQIKEMPSAAIDDLLRTEANINVDRKNGIFSKNASVNMRGLNSSARTLVMLDGVPLNKADGGGVNFNRINTENVERIEVIKGPGSAMYGGNAMGGVINVITKDIQKEPAGSVKVSLGSCNTQGAQVWLSGRTKALPKLGWSINSFYRRGDGYIFAPENQRDSTDVKAYLWEYNVGGKLAYNFNDSSRLEIGYNYFDDKTGDGIQVYDPEGGYYKYRTNHAYATYHGYIGKTQITANAYMQLENYMNQKESLKTEKVPPYAITQYVLYLTDSHRNDGGIWVSATTKAGENHKITYGSDIRLSGADASDIYFTSTDTITNKGKMNAFAVFVQDEFSMLNSRLKIVAGARADAVFFSDASFTIAAPSFTNSYMMEYTGDYDDKQWLAISPKLGARYDLSHSNSVYINYASGFRPGTLDDMCRSGSISKGFKMANPELEPEHLHNFEAGGSFVINKYMRIEPSVYYSIGNQFQYFVGTGDTVYSTSSPKAILQRENVSKAAVTGAEATLRVNPAKSLELTFSYAYNHSVIKSFDTVQFVAKDLSEKFLMEVPQNRFTAMLNWKNKYFNSMLVYEYTGTLYNDDENLVEMPPYYRFDAKVSHVFARHYSLAITIQNLTNNIYTDNKGNLGISRFVMFEAGYRF